MEESAVGERTMRESTVGKITAEENTCTTCNFYKQHYLIWRGQLIRASCGQCGNSALSLRTRIRHCPPACALWKPKEPPLETHRPTVEKLLRETRERLAIVAMLLTENNNT